MFVLFSIRVLWLSRLSSTVCRWSFLNNNSCLTARSCKLFFLFVYCFIISLIFLFVRSSRLMLQPCDLESELDLWIGIWIDLWLESPQPTQSIISVVVKKGWRQQTRHCIHRADRFEQNNIIIKSICMHTERYTSIYLSSYLLSIYLHTTYLYYIYYCIAGSGWQRIFYGPVIHDPYCIDR